MTLILGLHLAKKIYLISDTRITTRESFNASEYKDDFLKSFTFNKRISAVVAGNVSLASFFLKSIKKCVLESTTISDIRKVVEENLDKIISEYVNETGICSSGIAVIFGGFENKIGKQIEVSALGNAMSGSLVAKGSGTFMNQSMPTEIITALAKKIIENRRPLGKGNYIEILYTDSKVFSTRIEIDPNKYPEKGYCANFRDIECYKYEVFHPGQEFKKVKVPDKLISELEFRQRSEEFSEKILYEDTGYLMSFVKRIIIENNYDTVGGHIFPLLVTPGCSLFPTGDLAEVRDGKVVKTGRFFVENGIYKYELEDGTKGNYRSIQNFDASGKLDLEA